jgi:multidrug efflux pump subunit AcrA (membrane-fusion protein)
VILRAVLLCGALVVAGCRTAATVEETESQPPGPATVTVATVEQGDIDDVLHVTGETSALTVLRLASPAGGRVTALSVQPGDRLGAGEVAAEVLPLESEAAVNGFRVLERAGAISPAERASVREIEKNAAAREIRLSAPFVAVVGERLKNPGEQVAAGEVLLELYDSRSLVVVAQVPIRVATRLRKGMAASIRTAAETARGEVAAVQPSLAPGALTVPVRIVPSSPLEPPLRNAAVDCDIVLATHRAARLVPRSALVAVDSPGEARVLVASDGRARVRKVTIGIRAGDVVEVLSGLARGERVLTEGQFGLADGAPILVATPEAPPRPTPAE